MSLRHRIGSVVPPAAILLQALHHDPVELAANILAQPRWLRLAISGQSKPAPRLTRGQPRARLLRFLLANDPQHFIKSRLF